MQFGEQFVLIASKSLARMKIGIETADERFIIGAKAGNDVGEARFDLLSVLCFVVFLEIDVY